MSMNSDLFYCRPKIIDDEEVGKMIIHDFDSELKRHKLCDDEYRDAVFKTKEYQHRPTGEFMYADMSFHDLFQKDYFDKMGGGFIPLNKGWQCPKCGTPYHMALPPIECKFCHFTSPLGEYVKAGYVRR